MSLHIRGIRSQEQLANAAKEYERTALELESRSRRWRTSAADLDAAERLEARIKDENARQARVAAERAADDLFSMLHHRTEAPS